MLIMLSPAKKQQKIALSPITQNSTPIFKDEIQLLISQLKNLDCNELSDLMGISPKLAETNQLRFKTFNTQNYECGTPALALFQGDAYQALGATDLDTPELNWANQHLMILSGLYGVLRALDLIQPYRLEMSTPLKGNHFKNLYQFWGTKLADCLQQQLTNTQSTTIVNLASTEYSKAVLHKKHNLPVINIHFKELKDGKYKTIGILAKRARGMMTRWMIDNKPTDKNELKEFKVAGYSFTKEQSTESDWTFIRNQAL